LPCRQSTISAPSTPVARELALYRGTQNTFLSHYHPSQLLRTFQGLHRTASTNSEVIILEVFSFTLPPRRETSTMSDVLRISAIVHGTNLPRNRLENDDAPAFIDVNGETSSLRTYNSTGPKCVQAWKCAPQEPSFRKTSESVDLTTPAEDKTDESISKRERSHSNDTGYLRHRLGAMLAGPFSATPFFGRKSTVEPCQRSVPARDTTCLEHCANADIQDHEQNQTRKSGTRELQYTDVLSVNTNTDTPSERNGIASDDTIHNPQGKQMQARKRRQFVSRTKTGCETCRKRKKKCDEAKPKCQNCLRGNFECTGYTKPYPWSKNNAAQTALVLDLHQRVSSAAAPANIVPCPACNVIHTPWCEPSQKSYAEPTRPRGIATCRGRPACTDEQSHRIS
jgi:hypothetical protein